MKDVQDLNLTEDQQEAIQKMLNPTRVEPKEEQESADDLFGDESSPENKSETADDLFK